MRCICTTSVLLMVQIQRLNFTRGHYCKIGAKALMRFVPKLSANVVVMMSMNRKGVKKPNFLPVL